MTVGGAVLGRARCRVSVVIPALNVAANLPHLLALLPAGLHEVVLVDGHSTDGTVEVARARWPNRHIVARERRRGWVPARPVPRGHPRARMALRIVK